MEINKVYLGDCLELMKQIPDKSIDMILADLPYGITTCKWDTPIDLTLLWEQYKRIIKDNSAIVLTATMPFGANLIMSNPKWFRYEWIWEKCNGSNPLAANRKPMRVHENILIFSRKSAPYYPQKTVGKPYYVKPARGNLRHLRKLTRIPTDCKDGLRYPRSVQKFKKDYGKLVHSTQKPLALFEYLIKTYTQEGAIVLDNVAGSGTTGLACINTNRNYILMEKDEHYFNVINNRITDEEENRKTP